MHNESRLKKQSMILCCCYFIVAFAKSLDSILNYGANIFAYVFCLAFICVVLSILLKLLGRKIMDYINDNKVIITWTERVLIVLIFFLYCFVVCK